MSPSMDRITESVAVQLLDYNQKLQIDLLDQVVNCMYTGQGEEQKIAEKILTAMKEDANSWTRVDAILEYSQSQQTKYFGLQILENVIKVRWKVLPREQCEGIKKYIVGLIIKISSDAQSLESQSVFLGKLNMILVQILKHEWPKNWPTFISDIVGSSRTNESLCQNNLTILKLLSEEVFDFSAGQLTQAKAKHMKDSMCAEFSTIFELCQFVLRNSRTAPLVVSTLETLLKFMHWIPLGFVFETDLIEMLIKNFLSVPMFRNTTLKCLTEIAGIFDPRYDAQFVKLTQLATTELTELLPASTNIKDAYHTGTDDEQKFIQNLALFYSTLLREHLDMFEAHTHDLRTHLLNGLSILLRLSEVEDTEIFKICLEYWNFLANLLYRDVFTFNTVLFDPCNGQQYTHRGRKVFYDPILNNLRRIIISRMARPEEVLVVENEHGEVVREFMKDTDSINLYKTMRETLVYLTHLDPVDTQNIMTEKMYRLVNGLDWSWKNLNTLCWAIGSISGTFNEEDERRFLVVTVRDLLGLCEEKKGKDNKAIVASNIMYVVGQYPRFLRAHWRFLKTVVTKLFEFMHETHEGVQDMACDTFIKIAQKCRRQFVTVQIGETHTFVEDVLSDINCIICDLQPQQVHTFYEAVSIMISAHSNDEVREKLVEKLYEAPNQALDRIVQQATQNIDVLRDIQTVRQVIYILQANIHGCKALSTSYMAQLGRLYLDILNIYKVMSSNINQAIATHGEDAMKQPLIRSMRAVKKDTLRLISTWVISIGKRHVFMMQIAENFVPPLLDAVLADYCQNTPAAREPEVLNTMSCLVTELGALAMPFVPTILDSLFQCTMEMINRDMAEFPEHRTYFFNLLEAVNANCFTAFLQLEQSQFKLLLDSVIWAIKHTMRQVSETGFNILYRMLVNVSEIPSAQQQSFYQAFFMDILSHMFAVITDSSQSGSLTLQCSILAHMFDIVENNSITEPLSVSNMSAEVGGRTNVQFVHMSLTQLLKQAYPHLQDAQIRVFIDGLFSFDRDLNAFREHVRDFLVQIRQIAGEDMSDLYLEEQENEMHKAQEKKLEMQRAVPGLLGPHESLLMEYVGTSDGVSGGTLTPMPPPSSPPDQNALM